MPWTGLIFFPVSKNNYIQKFDFLGNDLKKRLRYNAVDVISVHGQNVSRQSIFGQNVSPQIVTGKKRVGAEMH